MSSADHKAVFLSYASQDAEAAKRICEALRAAGVEVWFDQNELVGGDAWDAKIRGQIASCALFMPVISASTQARLEGYFRIEWKLAARRTHAMATAKAFLLPLVIDDTPDPAAHVPDEFRDVQWTRLRSGEATPAFCARVTRLLNPTEPAVSPPMRDRSGGGGSRSIAAPAIGPSRPWLVPAMVGAVLVAAALFVWRPWTGEGTTASEARLPTPLSPARELVLKARHMFEDEDDSNRENLLLAADLLAQAEKLEPADGEVWAAQAQLSGTMLQLGYYGGDERRAELRRQAERAVKLAPDSLECQLARAWYLSSQHGTLPEAEQILTGLIKRAPADGRLLSLMAYVTGRLERFEESLAWFDRAAATPKRAAVARVDKATVLFLAGRFEEADKALDDALAIRPLGRAYLLKIRGQVLWEGDLDGARKTVERVPPSLLLEDRGAFNTYRVWLWRREPDQALAVLRGVSRDFLEDGQFVGPKAVLVASAQRLAGRSDLARSEWELALRLIDERLRSSPSQSRLLYLRALCLVELGRIPEAEAALRVFRQAGNEVHHMWPGGGLPGLLLKLGHPSEAMDELARRQQSGIQLFNSRAVLGLNPDFDPLRDDPRFQEIVARAPGPAKAATGMPASDSKSVAVLAFANLSEDKSNEYFSDGISEELLNVLAKVPGLKVSARTSAFHFKGKDTPIPDIARQLGVAYVVEGSVRKQGDKVRITAQLIKAADGFHVWSDTFTRDLQDVFAVQDEIAALIAQNLSLRLGVAASGPAVHFNPEAYRLYLEGRQAWALRNDVSFARARELFKAALALEPNFARALVGLADVGPSTRTTPIEARALVQQALSLEPSLSEAHATLGMMQENDWDFVAAEQSLRRAVELNPNNATAHQWLGRYLERRGLLEPALASLSHAAELDPLSPRILDNYASLLVAAGRFKEGLAVADRVLALQPSSMNGHRHRADALWHLGRRDEAVVEANWVVAHRFELTRNTARLACALAILRGAGHQAEVERIVRETPAPQPWERFWLQLGAGHHGQALELIDEVQVDDLTLVLWHELFDPIRTEPRFIAFLNRRGLVEVHSRVQRTRTDLGLLQRP